MEHNTVPFFAIRLQSVLNVMKNTFPDELSDFNWKLLLQQPLPDGMVVIKDLKMNFYVGGLPCVRTVTRGDDLSASGLRESTVEIMPYEDITAENLRRQKCIVFPCNIAHSMNEHMPELPQYQDVLIPARRHNHDVNINLYDQVVDGSWKGYRVLPSEQGGFVDSDDSELAFGDDGSEMEQEENLDSFLHELNQWHDDAEKPSCYGCRINHPSQREHMGPGGCMEEPDQEPALDVYQFMNDALMQSDNESEEVDITG